VIGGENRTFTKTTNAFLSAHPYRQWERPDFIFGIDITKLTSLKEPLANLEEDRQLPNVWTVKYTIDKDLLV